MAIVRYDPVLTSEMVRLISHIAGHVFTFIVDGKAYIVFTASINGLKRIQYAYKDVTFIQGE